MASLNDRSLNRNGEKQVLRKPLVFKSSNNTSPPPPDGKSTLCIVRLLIQAVFQGFKSRLWYRSLSRNVEAFFFVIYLTNMKIIITFTFVK